MVRVSLRLLAVVAVLTASRVAGQETDWQRPMLPPGALVQLQAKPVENGNYCAVAFAPDGKVLALGIGKRVALHGHDGKLIREMNRHGDEITALAFTPSGKLLASASLDRTIRIWDPASGKEARVLEGHKDAVLALAFSADGKLLGSASRDKTARLWDAGTGKEHCQLGHPASVTTLAFARDGKSLATGSKDQRIRLWDPATGKEVAVLGRHRNQVTALAFAPGSRTLVSASQDSTIRIWDVVKKEKVQQLAGYDGGVTAVAVSPDGKMIASLSRDRAVHVWETLSGKERLRFGWQGDFFLTLAFSPDGMRLASASPTAAFIWDASGNARPTVKPSSTALDLLWANLASTDAAVAFQAIGRLTANPDQALPLIERQLKILVKLDDPERIDRLIADLDSNIFTVRNLARRELMAIGNLARPALVRALANKPTLETRRSIDYVMDRIDPINPPPAWLRSLRTVEVLERIGTDQARKLLKQLIQESPANRCKQEAQASLDRLAKP